MQDDTALLGEAPLASVVIPVWNGAKRLSACLASLQQQVTGYSYEIIVVDDGSTDDVRASVARFPQVRLIRQPHLGPSVARNRGALEARGAIVLFTDSDCCPCPDWLEAMVRPFIDSPDVVGVSGAYGTDQTSVVPKLIQAEYDQRYRMLARRSSIDFVSTDSAGYRRSVFLEYGGFSEAFVKACAEDSDLSYRLSSRQLKIVFSPQAVVKHYHPDSLWWYWRRKYKYSYWRMLAFRRSPSKMVADSHTPQLMKLQSLVGPATLISLVWDLQRGKVLALPLVLSLYLLSVLPFSIRILRREPAVALIAPAAFFGRAVAQFAGAVAGSVRFMTPGGASDEHRVVARH
jgi:GT2 family glycosyltransferase